MKILVTGFEPFGSHHSNPSWDAVEALLEEIEGVQIVKRKLPVSFRRFSAPLEAAIEEERPDGLICVGLAGGEDKVSVERVGINLMEARIPDNDGFQPFDTPICPDWRYGLFFHASCQAHGEGGGEPRDCLLYVLLGGNLRVQRGAVYGTLSVLVQIPFHEMLLYPRALRRDHGGSAGRTAFYEERDFDGGSDCGGRGGGPGAEGREGKRDLHEAADTIF